MKAEEVSIYYVCSMTGKCSTEKVCVDVFWEEWSKAYLSIRAVYMTSSPLSTAQYIHPYFLGEEKIYTKALQI